MELDKEMETKTLRLEGTPGKLENKYVMSVPVPGKVDLLQMIEKPPFHIFSKEDTTFSTGILSQTPHSLKVRISRDYQEPFVGVYIKVCPKADDVVEVTEVKGAFTSVSTIHGAVAAPKCIQGSHAAPQPSQPNHVASNANSSPTSIPFHFFKNSVSKLLDLENYEYYESRCQWPETSCRLDLIVTVTKTTYAVLVTDESWSSSESDFIANLPTSSYFMSTTFSDVEIHVNDMVFPAHKIILSEKSRYFSRMFASSMKESTEGVIRISDEAESLFRELLRFIYCGHVENMEDNVGDLFILSDKYDIPELQTLCEIHLLKNLSVENAMEMFDLSQSIILQGKLAKKSKELIMWNKDKFATDLETFKDFAKKYPEIIFQLLQL